LIARGFKEFFQGERLPFLGSMLLIFGEFSIHHVLPETSLLKCNFNTNIVSFH